MEFDQNAAIFTATGETVGHIDRVVVEPETKAITHIVVRKGFLFHEDKVVPIQLIEQATANGITLRDNVGDLNALPLYEEKHYVASNDSGGGTVISQPLSGMPGSYIVEPREKLIKQVARNIPEGTVALKEGAKVTAADGKHIGHVERVITGVDANHATQLLVSHGTVSKEKYMIPMEWVTLATDEEVRLNVPSDKVLQAEANAS